jgi:hypothetical protein
MSIKLQLQMFRETTQRTFTMEQSLFCADVHCLALELNVSPQFRHYGVAGLGDW